MLRVSRQRIDQLRNDKRSGFPEPLAELGCGPIWDAADLMAYNKDRNRKPGRPRTTIDRIIAASPKSS